MRSNKERPTDLGEGSMTLWEQYDAIVSEIAVTGITERGENIGGWVAERRLIANALRDQLLGRVPPAPSAETKDKALARSDQPSVSSDGDKRGDHQAGSMRPETCRRA
jgi:hypothetical protein